MSAIHGRALLVALNISTWQARKLDKRVTEEVNRQHNAAAEAGRYTKNLLGGKVESYDAVVTAANKLRSFHYANTLAWSDDGWRLLPSANYMEYTSAVRALRAEYDDAVARFLREYPTLRLQAQSYLNGLYNPADYPDPETVAGRFKVSISFRPLPADGDFRLDLPADEVARITADVREQVQRATALAVRDAWERLRGVVAAAHERLSQPDAIFRDSLIGNIRELCDVLTRLNVTGDADLERLRARVANELARVEPDTLRKDKAVRAHTAAAAADILATIGDYFPSH